MSDPSTVAAYREAFAVNGVTATIQRVSGYAGAGAGVTTLASASVTVIVRDVAPDGTATGDSGLSGSTVGGLAQADRLVIVLADDLAAAGFPVPVARGDQVVLPDSAEVLNVVRVDPYKRALAGGIELYAAGIS